MISKIELELQSEDIDARSDVSTQSAEQDTTHDITQPNPEANSTTINGQLPNIRGGIDRIQDGKVTGWLFDSNQPEQRLTVETILDGFSLARAEANLPREDLANAGIGDGAYGFLLQLDQSLLDGKPHQLIAYEQLTGWQLPGTPVTFQATSDAHPTHNKLRGSFDSLANGRATGWVFDASRPGEPLIIEIMHGDDVVATGTADQFRQDLLDAAIGDGRHAFNLDVNLEALDDESLSFSVRVDGHSHRFPGPKPKPDPQTSLAKANANPHHSPRQQSGLSPGNPPHPPFDNIRDTNFFFPSARHAEALSRLFMSAEDRNMGIGVLTGEIGAGKTLVRTLLYSRLSDDDFVRVSIENSLLDFDGMLLEIISQMQGERVSIADLPDRYSRLAALKRLILDEVASRDRHLVILIDEAQELSIATLRALKGLTNISPEDGSYLTLILIGQPELNVQLKQLPQVEQRVSQRFYLTGLDREETGYYIRHRFRVSGYQGEPPVTDEAIDIVYQVTRGIPRAVNRLCKLALNYRLAHGGGLLDAETVKAVTDDIRQHKKPTSIKHHF